MEPHREEPQKAPEPSAEQRPKRFRLVKLEERVAPSTGGRLFLTREVTGCGCNASNYTCHAVCTRNCW
jgi:hypothetical protein